ncbi:unnamed protein product [Didymodactylos carnosus]|uniref:Retrotransposon gag domain-containing protein n=1 Tax=Didymodactylos carnosus TaxID=1234261 RepID=A0A816CMH6_9BILA|nr:unnamed protein product [Didymodactylos carnosus]CAF1626368.1 unnamed protein product [Didymodactylos carnosus]CAF4139478.1 unnamed protein product [Didymodactylos carnosus]CAF4520573.1 unnamed protein product [Didymodactylos carnosus]
MDNVEQFKTFEKDQLDTIQILDHTRTDTILVWLSSIEQVFTDLSYKERLWPSLSYDYLDSELQDWYNKSIFSFSNDWTKFKTQLGLYINQASALSTSAVNFQLTTTTDHNKSVETQKESSFTNDIKSQGTIQKHADQQKTNQFLQFIGAFPKFYGGTGAESWLTNILKQFKDLDIDQDIRLYYVKHIMEDQALSWYFENEDEFSSFAAFVKLFRAHFIKVPAASTPILTSHPSCFSTLQSNITCTASAQFEGILLPALLEDFLKKQKQYSGGKENVVRWLEDLEQQFSTVNWPNDMKLKYIARFLKDEARQWYIQNSSHISSWSAFKKEFTTVHSSTYYVTQSFQCLQQYSQAINQCVLQYHTQVLQLCQDANPDMDERTKVQYLMANLLASLKMKVISKDPQTTDQFLQIARKAEDLQALVNQDERMNNYSNDSIGTTSNVNFLLLLM